jgi:hypothetical protein
VSASSGQQTTAVTSSCSDTQTCSSEVTQVSERVVD